MECMSRFLQDTYQAKLRMFAQSKSERYEDTLENYKQIFLSHLNLVLKDCSEKCAFSEECGCIRTVIKGISEEKIVNFFDEIRMVYLEWIDAKTINSLQRFSGLLDKYDLFKFQKEISGSDVFFKARASSQILTKWDMFHIPFNKRHLIGNQRFSLTGQPMLYIGSSVLDVAEEIGIENISDMKVASVRLPQEGLKIFDLRNNVLEEYVNFAFNLLLGEDGSAFGEAHFFRMILASVCRFQKRQELKGFTFCEEYVLPQILAQIVKGKGFDGIAYYSTKRYENVEDGNNGKFEVMEHKENIAIFTTLSEKHAYDRALFEKITISVPIDIDKIDKIGKMSIEDLEEIIKEIGQSNNQMKISSAEKLFTKFKRIYDDMTVDKKKYYDSEYGMLHMHELYTILNDILIA